MSSLNMLQLSSFDLDALSADAWRNAVRDIDNSIIEINLRTAWLKANPKPPIKHMNYLVAGLNHFTGLYLSALRREFRNRQAMADSSFGPPIQLYPKGFNR